MLTDVTDSMLSARDLMAYHGSRFALPPTRWQRFLCWFLGHRFGRWYRVPVYYVGDWSGWEGDGLREHRCDRCGETQQHLFAEMDVVYEFSIVQVNDDRGA